MISTVTRAWRPAPRCSGPPSIQAISSRTWAALVLPPMAAISSSPRSTSLQPAVPPLNSDTLASLTASIPPEPRIRNEPAEAPSMSRSHWIVIWESLSKWTRPMQQSSIGVLRSWRSVRRSTAPITQTGSGSPSTNRPPSMEWVPQFNNPCPILLSRVSGFPIAPSRTSSLARSQPRVKRRWWLTTRRVPPASQASTMRSASAMLTAIGFSQITPPTPALPAAITGSGCRRCQVQTLTRSGEHPASSSSTPANSSRGPYSRLYWRRASATGSATATSSTPARRYPSAWAWPIDPQPTMAAV